MKAVCKHDNLQDGWYTSSPPKKKCLDCGGYFTEKQLKKEHEEMKVFILIRDVPYYEDFPSIIVVAPNEEEARKEAHRYVMGFDRGRDTEYLSSFDIAFTSEREAAEEFLSNDKSTCEEVNMTATHVVLVV